MYSLRRKVLSQNFLYNRKLVKSLIRNSSIGFNDIVLEIGSGKGIITEELASLSKKVISIEIDSILYLHLKNKFASQSSIQLHNMDFLDYKLPQYSYKVFANIPFSIEGNIIRKLLNAPNPPEDSYLVMRRDLAERVGGIHQDGQFSICYKPFFEFNIIHYFHKTDFKPSASMDTVLLNFQRRKIPFIALKDRLDFIDFVEKGFGGGKRLKYNLRSFFTFTQLKRLSREYQFNPESKPSDLNLMNWVNLFIFTKDK